jgi:LacI family transcriptional regulator
VTVSAPGIKDVAARAGVSIGTVSNVLNRPAVVSPRTRRRVEDAITELGFVRNESARQLRAGSSRAIAYLALDAANPFFVDVANGIEDAARIEGLGVFQCNSDEDAGRERHYLDLLLEQRVRGVLVTPVDPDSERLRALPALGVPVVLVDRTSTDRHAWCRVSVDDVEGGDLAVTHLLEQGHRRIAFVGGPSSLSQVRDRLHGAVRAVSALGLDDRVDGDVLTTVPTAALNVAEGRRAGERLAGLPARRRPTAAFCANDLVALGLLQEMTRQGLTVPADLAIVGYDDIDFAAAAAVPLTSVRQPRRLLGQAATELLLEEAALLGGPTSHAHRQLQFRPELVVRSSTRRGRGASDHRR